MAGQQAKAKYTQKQAKRKKKLKGKGIYGLIYSEALIVLSTLAGGLGLYLILNVSWTLFPFLLIAPFLYGLSCLGLERLQE